MRNRAFFLATLLSVLLIGDTAQAAFIGGLNSKMARFMGGTVETIPRYATGWLKTDNDSALVFVVSDDARLRLHIPYAAITEIEYGQEVSRRVMMAIALRSRLPLLSKSRKHYLTINYTDSAGATQAIVLELGKDIVRTTIASLEARTGHKVVPQDADARKKLEKK